MRIASRQTERNTGHAGDYIYTLYFQVDYLPFSGYLLLFYKWKIPDRVWLGALENFLAIAKQNYYHFSKFMRKSLDSDLVIKIP